MGSNDELVLQALTERVLTVTINRAAERNTISRDVTDALHRIITAAANDPNVGAVILTGAGATFCAGGDIRSLSSADPKPDEALLGRASEVVLALHRMPKPTIAMVRGAAAGGGLALAVGCDFRIVGPTAKFTYAYTKIALTGDYAANYMVEKLLGTAKAREFCLLCPIVGAEEAVRIGLATRLVADEELEQVTYAMARDLANGPTSALGRIKQNLNAVAEMSLEEAVQLETENFAASRKSSDHREAARAFLEKRKPVFHTGG